MSYQADGFSDSGRRHADRGPYSPALQAGRVAQPCVQVLGYAQKARRAATGRGRRASPGVPRQRQGYNGGQAHAARSWGHRAGVARSYGSYLTWLYLDVYKLDGLRERVWYTSLTVLSRRLLDSASDAWRKPKRLQSDVQIGQRKVEKLCDCRGRDPECSGYCRAVYRGFDVQRTKGREVERQGDRIVLLLCSRSLLLVAFAVYDELRCLRGGYKRVHEG